MIISNKFNLSQSRELMIIDIKNLKKSAGETGLQVKKHTELLHLSYQMWEAFVKKRPTSVLSKRFKKTPESLRCFQCEGIINSTFKNLTHEGGQKRINRFISFQKQLVNQIQDKQQTIDSLSRELTVSNTLKGDDKVVNYKTYDLQVPSEHEEGDDSEFMSIEDYAEEIGGLGNINLDADLILRIEWTIIDSAGYKTIGIRDYHHIWTPARVDGGTVISASGTWWYDSKGLGNPPDFVKCGYELPFRDDWKNEAEFLTNACVCYINKIESYR